MLRIPGDGMQGFRWQSPLLSSVCKDPGAAPLMQRVPWVQETAAGTWPPLMRRGPDCTYCPAVTTPTGTWPDDTLQQISAPFMPGILEVESQTPEHFDILFGNILTLFFILHKTFNVCHDTKFSMWTQIPRNCSIQKLSKPQDKN